MLYLKHCTLMLCMCYENCCCSHYAFNTNVNTLEYNGYFSTLWCSCTQITTLHTELWIKWCGSVFSKTLVEITSQDNRGKFEVTVYLPLPCMAVSLKVCDVVVSQWCSQAAVSLKAMQQCSVFVWKVFYCSTAIYPYILYASGLVSWHKFSLANIFLHSDQPTTTAVAFHLYSHLLHLRLGNILYKQDQKCPNWQKRAL